MVPSPVLGEFVGRTESVPALTPVQFAVMAPELGRQRINGI